MKCNGSIIVQNEKGDLSKPRGVKDYLRLILTGFAMGASDIVPGVSGGTMAFVLGVYTDLVNAIKSFNLEALRLLLARRIEALLEHISFRFLLALGVGLALAVISLSGYLSAMMDDPAGRVLLFAFFFGLVGASIISVGAKVRWHPPSALSFAVGVVVAFIIVNAVPAEADHSAPALFVSGMIAITAMILPGISGSFMLLIMGQYDYVLGAVSQRDLPPIIAVGCGAVVGIIAFSRVLSYLLAHHYRMTVALLVGFMTGSLWKIFPWRDCLESDLDRHGDFRCLADAPAAPDPAGDGFWIAILLMVVGFVLVNALDHLEGRNNPLLRRIWR